MKTVLNGMHLDREWKTGTTFNGARPQGRHTSRASYINGHPLNEDGCVLNLTGFPGSGAVIKDLSGQGNHGALTNTTWAYQNGIPYQVFNGTDAVTDCGNISALDTATAFTGSAWIRNDTGGADYSAYISRLVSGSYSGFVLQRTDANTAIRLFGFNSTPSSIAKTIVVGVWNHIFFTWDGTTHSFMLNGDTPGTSTIQGAAPMYTSGASLTFGKINYATSYCKCSVALPFILTQYYSAEVGRAIYQSQRHLLGV